MLLESLGGKVQFSEQEDVLCTIQGPLKLNQSVSIDCSKTTQVASSLYLIKEKIGLTLDCKNLKSSLSYYEMTKNICRSDKEEHSVPIDMSSASYFIALAALKNTICFKGLCSRDKLQADDQLLDLVNYSFSPDLVVLKQEIQPFTMNASSCIDLVPTLAFLGSFIDGESYIYGIENLVYKETDRLEGICEILSFFNVSYEKTESSLKIFGDSKKLEAKSKRFIPKPDHRLVMMASLFYKMLGGGEVGNSDCVEKSFPNFFTIL
jgi:3-phosphoshikimate 1-carboxyvinyltransferase